MPPNRRLSRDIRWGVANGALFAAVLSGLVAIVRAPSGELTGSRLWLVIATYFASGISAGLVVGILRPWTRRRIGAVLVGIVAAVPVGIAIGLAYDMTSQQHFSWLVLLLFTVIAGPLGGWIRWSQTWGRASDGADQGPGS